MLKKIIALVFTLGVALSLSSSAHAQSVDQDTYRHAYKPYMVNGLPHTMRARIDNFATTPQNKLVCVEAFNNANSMKTHLGCLWMMLDSFNSNGMWAKEFDVPMHILAPGNYTVVYTYQAVDGTWKKILSTTLQVMDGVMMR